MPPTMVARLTWIAGEQGVSLERLVEIIRKRRLYRRAIFHRRRSRKRSKMLRPFAKRRRMVDENPAVMAGEGELHPLLRAVGLTREAFCKIAGISTSSFHRWYGHPLHTWAIELIRYYGWAKNMAEYLRKSGVDPEQFKPQVPTRRLTMGHYPRTAEQGKKLLEGLQHDPNP